MAEYQNTREIALEILLQVMEKEQYSHIVLRQALEKYNWMDRTQKAFVSKLSQGTIERCIELDAVLNYYSTVPVSKMKPLVRNLLRISLYQILYMDKVPDSAACNEAVKMANAHGFCRLKGFINGVLRRIVREKDAGNLSYSYGNASEWSVRYSMPDWIIQMCRQTYGEEKTLRMLAYVTDNQEEKASSVSFYCLDCVGNIEQVKGLFCQDGIEVAPDRDIPNLLHAKGGMDTIHSLTPLERGYVQIQDKSSVLCGLAVSPEKESVVIDACGAPGGKSIFLANYLKGTGMVYSCDISDIKCSMIQENVQRTGLNNIKILQKDALVFDPAYEEQADYVLADLPCSGLGIMGKKGDIKYKMNPDKQREIVMLQRQMLSVLSRYVKKGGVLVYSTCTIHPGENWENRQWFLEHFPFVPESLEGLIPEAYCHTTAKDGYLQLLPGVDDTDGFFFARFRKEADAVE